MALFKILSLMHDQHVLLKNLYDTQTLLADFHQRLIVLVV